MASRFDPITTLLRSTGEDTVILTFAEIEGLVGPLCKSATQWDPYWHESKTHTITHSWLRAGYVLDKVSRAARKVTLRRHPTEAASLPPRYGETGVGG